MKKSSEKVVLAQEREERSPSKTDLLGLVASETEALRRPDEVVIGKLVSIGETGEARVDFPENPTRGPVEARSTVRITKEGVGREVALLFERGDPRKPIVVGFLWQPAQPKATAEVDGETVVLSAEREIVLRCGKASITLTRAGKIILRGTYLLSRSSGVNRIKGGSVQLN